MRLAGVILAAALAFGGDVEAGVLQGQEHAAVLAFDVASVRQSRSGDEEVSSNVPLGPGNVYAATGGVLTARNFPLVTYLAFAYRMTDAQLESIRAQAPGWAETDRFDIQARTDKQDVTKNEMRLMMRALLAERFGLVMHTEVREVPVFGLVLVTPGKTGPGLRVHPAEAECVPPGQGLVVEGPETVPGGFPTVCGGILQLPAKGPSRIKLGGRNVAMRLIADSLSLWGQLGRPVVDRTGLSGLDFVLEYTPQLRPEADAMGEDAGDTFRGALKKQLGVRLEAMKSPVELLILDHVEHPKEN